MVVVFILWFGIRLYLALYMMNIMAKANDTNDILQTFR